MVTFLGIETIRINFTGTPEAFESLAQVKTSMAFAALTIPLVIFSLPGGWLADRFSKRSVIISLKYFELFIMTCAAFALAFDRYNFSLLISILVLLGIHSSLFSPSKYGILTELVSEDRLTYANSQLELWTFLAIILGTASGGILLGLTADHPAFRGIPLILFALIGLLGAHFIPKVPPAHTEIQWKESISKAYSIVRQEPELIFSICGSVLFWGLASLLGQNVVVYSKAVLSLSDAKSGLPLAICGLGVGLGSMIVPRLSRNKIRYSLIPIGAIVLTIATFLIGYLQPQFRGVLVLMGVSGIASALIAIPLQSVLQWKAPDKYRGAVLSFGNVFIFSGTFAGTFLTGILGKYGISSLDIFYLSAAITFTASGLTLYFMKRQKLS